MINEGNTIRYDTQTNYSWKKSVFLFTFLSASFFTCICLSHLRPDVHSAEGKWYWIPFARRFFQDIQRTSLCFALPLLSRFPLPFSWPPWYLFIYMSAFDAISLIYSGKRTFVLRRFKWKEKGTSALRNGYRRITQYRFTNACKDYLDDIFWYI